MDDTIRLQLPYIMPAQAQKHVTHNEALRRLDVLVQACALDRDRTHPPADPAEGDCHIVAAGVQGAWTGAAGRLAAWQDGAWALLEPSDGWRVWSVADAALLVFRQGEWQPIADEPGEVDMLGVNAVPDAVNRMAVASQAVLFNHVGAGQQVKINKAAAQDSASLLFQTDFAGRAELGTTGDEDFRVKVSLDGAIWRDAIVVDRATGAVLLPNTPVRPSRERLTGDRTYHVRTDGNDGNDGLANSPAGAFATVQRALDVVYGTIDLGFHNVTIQVGAGTFAQSLNIQAPYVGAGQVTLQGAGADTVIARSPTNPPVYALNVANNARLIVAQMEIQSTALGIHVASNAVVTLQTGLRFGGVKGGGLFNIQVSGGASIAAVGTHTLLANSGGHIRATLSGQISYAATLVTNTVAFSTAFAQADRMGLANFLGFSFTGSPTGKRYDAWLNGAISAGGNPTFLPGSVAGTIASGGQYG